MSLKTNLLQVNLSLKTRLKAKLLSSKIIIKKKSKKLLVSNNLDQKGNILHTLKKEITVEIKKRKDLNRSKTNKKETISNVLENIVIQILNLMVL